MIIVCEIILFLPQNVCRSATLSTMAEMYGRAGMDWFTGIHIWLYSYVLHV